MIVKIIGSSALLIGYQRFRRSGEEVVGAYGLSGEGDEGVVGAACHLSELLEAFEILGIGVEVSLISMPINNQCPDSLVLLCSSEMKF